MINLRNAMMVDGKRLPYDAEVEWIQGDGSSYIDFPDVLGLVGKPIILNNTPPFRLLLGIHGFVPPETDFIAKIGVAMASVRPRFLQNMSSTASSYGSLSWGGNTALRKSTYPTVGSVGFSTTVDGSGHAAHNIVNGEVVSTVLNLNYPTTYYASPRLFANGATNANGWSSTTNINGFLRVSYLLIESADSVVLDAIPVRKGQVGLMYDRVSGELFGNSSGTGAFVIGPDI